MVESQFYLTEQGATERLAAIADLSEDEVEQIVGRFRNDHHRFAGKLKGEVKVYFDGKVVIQHHFTKKKLWTSESSERYGGLYKEGRDIE